MNIFYNTPDSVVPKLDVTKSDEAQDISISHVITTEDLVNNPGLEEHVQVNDVIDIPVEAIVEVLEEKEEAEAKVEAEEAKAEAKEAKAEEKVAKAEEAKEAKVAKVEDKTKPTKKA